MVHLGASDPETAGLELERGGGVWERIIFNDPGTAVLLRGDEILHRSVPVAPGASRLVAVFFLDRAAAARGAHPRPRAAAPAAFLPMPGVPGFAPPAPPGALAAADLVLAVGTAGVPAGAAPGAAVAHFAAVASDAADFAFSGPPRRTLAHALGLA